MKGEQFLSGPAVFALLDLFGDDHGDVVIPDPADEPGERLVLSAFIRPDFFSKLSAPGPLTAVRREMVLEKRQWRAGRVGGFFWGRAGEDDPVPLAATEAAARAASADRARSRSAREDISPSTLSRVLYPLDRLAALLELSRAAPDGTLRTDEALRGAVLSGGLDYAAGDSISVGQMVTLGGDGRVYPTGRITSVQRVPTLAPAARAVVSWMIARARRARAA